MIFFPHFKISMRMLPDRADVRSSCTLNNVAAVAAFPYRYSAFYKYSLCLSVVQQCPVPLLMCLFNRSYAAELFCKIMESFFIRFLSHAVIHIRPLRIFSLGGMEKIFSGIANFPKRFEPQLCMLLFIFGSMQE